MQFKETLMNQTWENGKKPNLGPDFGLLAQIFHPSSIFFCVCEFYLH